MKKILFLAAFISICVACDRQEDLYDTGAPMLYILGNWVPTLGIADMNGKATATLYKDGEITTAFFNKPNSVTVKVTKGVYDVLLFNGLMFSEENTNLDHIYFRNTDNVETFEACVMETAPNPRLVRTNDEFLASSDMEILTSSYRKLSVDGEYQYHLKYENGRDVKPVIENFIEKELSLVPYAVSYFTQIVAHCVNPSSAGIANGSLRGFIGSVYMASGMPSHFDVTHQIRLNLLTIINQGTPGSNTDPETGTIESPWFVTFGPPIDLPGRRYTFEIHIILRDGEVINETFDITDQVTPVIKEIKTRRSMTGTEIPSKLTISIQIPLIKLPEIESGTEVTVNDWGDDEIIKTPI